MTLLGKSAPPPVAIVDIGSNSIRLVVYAGTPRIPSIIFNEKMMAGLGRSVARTGALSDAAQDRALVALRRFRLLVGQMGVARVSAVATAAVRDATNGAAFLDKVRELGFRPRTLSGEEEGTMAGLGVISGIPEADGVVGDLGGGSLELVEVARGEVLHSASIPFGVLRLPGLMEKGAAAFERKLARAIDGAGFRKRGRGRPFYLVGGSWRALARLDMTLTGHPLPITHHHCMPPGRAADLGDYLAAADPQVLKHDPNLPSSRLPTLPRAARLLERLVEELKPSELIVSSFGIREGLLFDGLDPKVRALDPLTEAAREAGRWLGRFPEHGGLLDRWIAPVFHDDPPAMARIRCAACHLSDIAWQVHPDFRAERGVNMGLHGNWVGIDMAGRVMLAQALFANYGGRGFEALPAASLCKPAQLHRASLWGLALRLAQRLSGGVAASLERSRLRIRGEMLRLELKRGDEALFGEAVERRLKTLAAGMGLGAEAVVS